MNQRDIADERLYLGIGPGLGEDDVTVGVANQNHAAARRSDGAFRDSDVILQRDRRVLDDGDIVTVTIEDVVNALPSRTIDEAAVDKNDGFQCAIGCHCCWCPWLRQASRPMRAS